MKLCIIQSFYGSDLGRTIKDRGRGTNWSRRVLDSKESVGLYWRRECALRMGRSARVLKAPRGLSSFYSSWRCRYRIMLLTGWCFCDVPSMIDSQLLPLSDENGPCHSRPLSPSFSFPNWEANPLRLRYSLISCLLTPAYSLKQLWSTSPSVFGPLRGLWSLQVCYSHVTHNFGVDRTNI